MVPRWLCHILGVGECSDKLVLDDLASFAPLTMTKRGKQTDYEVHDEP